MFNQLYMIRHRRRMTQAELAEAAGVARSTICNLECTGRIPSIAVGVRLCRALHCSFEEVFPVDLAL